MKNRKEKLQIRPHFKSDTFENSENWAFAFELLLGDEICKVGGRAGEKEKRLPMVDREAEGLLINLPAEVNLAD